MKNELVSIIMPSYNSAKYIAESIESVVAQSFHNWELLITDDCSTDNTREIVEAYATHDPRIKLFILEQNSGAGVARNNSIEQAAGRFIAFLDSDDVWMPQKLEKQVAFMLNNGYTFTFTSYDVCDANGCKIGGVNCNSRINFFRLLCDNCVGCLTGMYDAKQLGKIYMPILRKRQDWCLWLSVIKMSKNGFGLQERLAKYRVVTNSVSSNKLSLVEYNIKVYNDFLGYSKLVSYVIFFLLFIPTYTMKKIIQKFNK